MLFTGTEFKFDPEKTGIINIFDAISEKSAGPANCIAYVRNNPRDEDTLIIQTKKIEEYCQNRGYQIADIYKAQEACNEDQLQDILQRIKEKYEENQIIISRLVAVKPNTISRDIPMLLKLHRDLKSEGIIAETLEENDFDSSAEIKWSIFQDV